MNSRKRSFAIFNTNSFLTKRESTDQADALRQLEVILPACLVDGALYAVIPLNQNGLPIPPEGGEQVFFKWVAPPVPAGRWEVAE